MKWREYRFQATISLPDREVETFDLSLENNNYHYAVYDAKQMIMKEEKLSDEQEKYIKLEEITG